MDVDEGTPELDGEDDEDLESESDDADVDFPQSRRINLSVDKPLRDLVIGSTTYTVPKPQSRVLAPKVSKDSRNKRETFLHARGPKGGANRGSVKKSFF